MFRGQTQLPLFTGDFNLATELSRLLVQLVLFGLLNLRGATKGIVSSEMVVFFARVLGVPRNRIGLAAVGMTAAEKSVARVAYQDCLRWPVRSTYISAKWTPGNRGGIRRRSSGHDTLDGCFLISAPEISTLWTPVYYPNITG